MPLFEYRCSACEHLEEVLQKHGEPPPAVCPKCGKKKTLHKELSRTSFQLKGGGWYKDLYSSSPAPATTDSAPSDRPGDRPGDKAGDKAGDKPAEKPAEKKAEPAKKTEKKTDKKAKAAAAA
jgi:putative FmdB family regulatory protein